MRRLICLLSLAAMAAAMAVPALAQRHGVAAAPPEVLAKRAAWEKWRENNKNVLALQQILMGLRAVEQDPRIRMKKAQARKVLAVIHKWQAKKAITDAQARQINKQIGDSLTLPQIQRVAITPAPDRGASAGGPQGRRRGGDGSRHFDLSKMPDPHAYNPLNPDTLPFERQRPVAKRRLAELIGELKAAK